LIINNYNKRKEGKKRKKVCAWVAVLVEIGGDVD
jgi:hypothetical protein